MEVVATDGPVNEARQAALMGIATEAGFREHQVAFVTAYAVRDAGAFKGSVSEIAWRSFVWFMSGTRTHHGAASRRQCRPGASVRVDARLIAALGHPPRPLLVITG